MKDDRLIWRIYLEPIFRRKKYSGAMWRVLNALCEIQAGQHLTVYAGAWGLSRRSGVSLRYVKRILRRLERDEVLQLVEGSRGGRFSDDAKRGSPGVACGFQLGRACYSNGGETTTVKGGQLTTVPNGRTVVKQPPSTVVKRPPQPNGGQTTTPSVVTPSLTLGRNSRKKEGMRKEGTPTPQPQRPLIPESPRSTRGNGLWKLGQILTGGH